MRRSASPSSYLVNRTAAALDFKGVDRQACTCCCFCDELLSGVLLMDRIPKISLRFNICMRWSERSFVFICLWTSDSMPPVLPIYYLEKPLPPTAPTSHHHLLHPVQDNDVQDELAKIVICLFNVNLRPYIIRDREKKRGKVKHAVTQKWKTIKDHYKHILIVIEVSWSRNRAVDIPV